MCNIWLRETRTCVVRPYTQMCGGFCLWYFVTLPWQKRRGQLWWHHCDWTTAFLLYPEWTDRHPVHHIQTKSVEENSWMIKVCVLYVITLCNKISRFVNRTKIKHFFFDTETFWKCCCQILMEQVFVFIPDQSSRLVQTHHRTLRDRWFPAHS